MKELEILTNETRTMIFYESPRRLVKTLEQFCQVFGGQRECCVSREISKLHEEHFRGTLEQALGHFSVTEPKGEIVLTLAGLPSEGVKVHRNKYRQGTEEEQDYETPQEQERD